MTAVMNDIGTSWALSPEQRALLGQWGGEACVREAVHLLRIEIASAVPPAHLRAAVAQAALAHAILQAALCPVPGYRGLRMQAVGEPIALAWRLLTEEEELAEFGCAPLDVPRGELLRAALLQRDARPQILALAVSALVVDRGSLATLAGLVARACRDGEASVQDVFPYRQYVEWREEIEAGEDALVGRDYWRQYLQGADEWVAPRLAYRRSGVSATPAGRLHAACRIDAALTARVAEAASAAGTRPEVLLQTVWWVLLARLTGFNRYAAGWQHDCRSDYDLMQGAVGVFDKVLPLLVEGGGDEPFSAWLARMAALTASHAEAQEYCPIDAPVARAHLAIGFACHDVPPLPLAMPWRVVELPGPMPCFELAMQVDASAEGTALTLHADASAYPRLAIERLLGQYVTLLQGALEQPDSPVSVLPWVSEPERQAVQAGLQGPAIDFGRQTLAQRVADWAIASPGAWAVESGDRRLSYEAFDASANRLAHWLRAQGVEAGALVALELPRSIELVVAILAAWRIGAGYLPLEPEWPAARRQAVLDDARPALVLRLESVSDAGPWRESAVGEIDASAFPATPPEYAAREDDPAYVLYTSGSTGRPKGVLIEQRQLLNYVAAATSAMDLAACRRWGLASSVAADLGNTALFGALFNGACVVIAGVNEANDAEAFARFIAAHEVDALKIVPSHLAALMESDALRLPRLLVLGGEAAPKALIERIGALAPTSTIYNHYGPTETTVGVMVHRVDRGAPVPEVLPLSRVLANNRVLVLDPALRPVPAGGLGEIHVGGAQVCRGYLNREAGDVFVSDPWRAGERLYRTGDLAWVLPEGGVRLAGRSDHQVKIRGYRVEPVEVEAALLGLPGVRQAAVMARADNGATELVAFVVGDVDTGAEASRFAWREHLAALLPAHMLPAACTVLEELPRLPNGKIDRVALAQRMPVAGAGCKGAAAPRGALEALLANAMASLLGGETLAADADFFEQGGHSLLVIRLVARIRKVLQVEVEPGLVFDHPTARALAGVLCAGHDGARLERLAQGHGARV